MNDNQKAAGILRHYAGELYQGHTIGGRWPEESAHIEREHDELMALADRLSQERGEAVARDADEAVREVMEQAQVFASTWATVGGRFDTGHAMEDAEEAKDELRRMVQSLATLAAEAHPTPDAGRVAERAVANALEAAVSALYLNDSSDFGSALWEVVTALDPAMAKLLEEDERAAYQQAKTRAEIANKAAGEA